MNWAPSRCSSIGESALSAGSPMLGRFCWASGEADRAERDGDAAQASGDRPGASGPAASGRSVGLDVGKGRGSAAGDGGGHEVEARFVPI